MTGRMLLIFLWTGAVMTPAVPAHALPALEVVISEVGQRDADDMIGVELRLLNDGEEARVVPLPDQIQAIVEAEGTSRTTRMERAPGVPSRLTVQAGGFARARYRFRVPVDWPMDRAMLSVPRWHTQRIAMTAVSQTPSAKIAQAAPQPAQSAAQTLPEAAPAPADRTAGNAFLGNLSAYEPVYAVYGPGTDSEARIQLSFKYQLFGTRQADGLPRSWRDGLHFAYTQRMFWDLGAHSSPFRNIDYQPEFFYLTPSTPLANSMTISAQAGIRHESNGRDGTASRSINSIYFAPMAGIDLGSGYRLSLAPQLSFFVGDKSDNRDIHRYRGNTGFFMEVGEDEGLRLSTSTRLNFSTGKGALNADLSYPLARLLGGGPDFYLFGQSFVGYGENLLDYDRRMTRFRIGLALVR